MGWAVLSHPLKIEDHMIKGKYNNLLQTGDVHQLQLLMDNWTAGMADKTTSYEVRNGLDA